MDVDELQRIAVPQIATLSSEELEQVVSAAPVTDQPSFERYLWATPKYANARKRYTESQYSEQPLSSESMSREEALVGGDGCHSMDDETMSSTLLARLSSMLFGTSKDSSNRVEHRHLSERRDRV